MTFRASRARVFVAALTGSAFILAAIVARDRNVVVRSILALGGGALVVLAVSELWTRITITTEHVEVVHGLKRFRCRLGAVTPTWTPIPNGIGRGSNWMLTLAERGNTRRLNVPLSLFAPASVTALRAELTAVVPERRE